MPHREQNVAGGRHKEIKRGELSVGGEGTPPREDIRPDTKLLWPFLFPQSLLPSVDCETKKGDRDRCIYLRVISSYAAENPRSAFFGVTKI